MPGSLSTKIRNVWSKISAGILLVTATAGLLYEILHKIGFKGVTVDFIPQSDVTIILLSLLCGGLGVERLLILGDIEESIKSANSQGAEILKKIQSSSKVDLLIDMDEIEAAACRLVKSCSDDDKIRATRQYFPEEATGSLPGPLSDAYYKAIAERLMRAKPGSRIEYQVVLPASSKSREGNHERNRQAFDLPGVAERVSTLHARGSWPFELLISGKSMNIAFPGGTRRRPTYEMAISVTDEAFVKKANEWFLELIRRETRDINQGDNPVSPHRAKKQT